jgi:ATP-dependent Lhr-like helicase
MGMQQGEGEEGRSDCGERRRRSLAPRGGKRDLGRRGDRERADTLTTKCSSTPVRDRPLHQGRHRRCPRRGSLEQDFVDRLVEQMSSFLPGGRAWLVNRVRHDERIVVVSEAPRGQKPSWGGRIPQLLGFDLCQRMRRIVVDEIEHPYLDSAANAVIASWRSDLGSLLRSGDRATQLDDGAVRWWTSCASRGPEPPTSGSVQPSTGCPSRPGGRVPRSRRG